MKWSRLVAKKYCPWLLSPVFGRFFILGVRIICSCYICMVSNLKSFLNTCAGIFLDECSSLYNLANVVESVDFGSTSRLTSISETSTLATLFSLLLLVIRVELSKSHSMAFNLRMSIFLACFAYPIAIFSTRFGAAT